MREGARAEFVAKYTAERNYQMLMKIYETTIERVERERKNGVSAVTAGGL
jgi:hypothetical protein